MWWTFTRRMTSALAHASLLSSLLTVTFLVVFGANPHSGPINLMQLHGGLQRDGDIGIISHRGAAALAPENTLAAIRAATEHGVDFVEVDLRLTRDGHPILMHDERVERTTDGWGRVSHHTLERIRTLDAGRWFDPAFEGERVPTLEEFTQAIDDTPARAFIELKDEWSVEQLAAVAAELRDHGLTNRVALLSFDLVTLEGLQAVAPEFARVLLTRELDEHTLETAITLNVSAIGTRETLATEAPEILERARTLGIASVAYTLNNESKWQVASDLGVDLIVTDDPVALAAWATTR